MNKMKKGCCVDYYNALNVTLRREGEYMMFLENAGRNHVRMFRWMPPRGVSHAA